MTDQAHPSAPLLRLEEAAAKLSVSKRTVAMWVASGVIPSVKLGSCRRIDPADLNLVIARGKSAA